MADISTDINDWSATAGSNSPSGSTAIGTGLDDNLRAIQAANASVYSKSYSAFQARLSLTSGTSVTTSDVTAAESVYLTPHKGKEIWLYTGSAWKQFSLSEIAIDVPDATQMSDVFAYINAGAPAAEVLAWSTTTSRATGLAKQDGIWVKSGDATRRYVGSFYSTTAGNGQTEDSYAKRYLWNYYNRVARPMRALEATNSWADTNATPHLFNSSAANALDFVVGVTEDVVTADALALVSGTTIGTSVGIYVGLDGVDATATAVSQSANIAIHVSGYVLEMTAKWCGYPGNGKHLLNHVVHGGTNVTMYGDAAGSTPLSGISGTVFG